MNSRCDRDRGREHLAIEVRPCLTRRTSVCCCSPWRLACLPSYILRSLVRRLSGCVRSGMSGLVGDWLREDEGHDDTSAAIVHCETGPSTVGLISGFGGEKYSCICLADSRPWYRYRQDQVQKSWCPTSITTTAQDACQWSTR